MAPVQDKVRSRSATVTVLDGAVDLARDRILVERCQRGDSAAFEELYHRYHRRLFHFCLRRLHDAYEAEDAVQEAFARAWRALPGFGGDRRFYPWLTVIAGNICTDVLRRQSRLTPTDDVPSPHVDVDGHDVDEAIMTEVDADMVAQALQNLSDRHQRVLRLREASGWSTQRIAEHEGVAVPAAETLLWRARQALKREFAALADTGARLGIALGIGVLAFRRLVGRASARLAGQATQLSGSAMGRPAAVLASAMLTAGAVSGAILVTSPGPSHAPGVVIAPVTTGVGNAPSRTESGSGRAASVSSTGASTSSTARALSSPPSSATTSGSGSSASSGSSPSSQSGTPGGSSTLLPAPAVPGPVSTLPQTVTTLPQTATTLPQTLTKGVTTAVSQAATAGGAVAGTTTLVKGLLTTLTPLKGSTPGSG
ncbi:MAG: sigma-70 family RNA polymerase sigma factor [Actinomycetota bacterium]|nr:sigma-70 family RNA polymerase sigma factor [Actinomycetota bacterium]